MDNEASNSPIDLAAQVLFALADGTQRGVRELAAELHRGKSSVQRALASLQDWSLVTIDPHSEKYSLGYGVVRLARSFLQDQSLSSRIVPLMRWVRDQTGETVTLSVRSGNERIIIQQIESLFELRWAGQVGRPYPIYAGATGKCLMAYMPKDQVSRILSSANLAAYSPTTITDPIALRQELAAVRKQGFAQSFGEYAPGGAGLAVPVDLDDGGTAAALALFGPGNRITEARMPELLPILRKAADAISSGSLVTPGADAIAKTPRRKRAGGNVTPSAEQRPQEQKA